ncbi:MAG: MEMO1 family protein [Candidatus Aenigmatarchaeota archaeon]
MIRSPAVAGMFYQLEPDKLKKEINSCFSRGGVEISEESFKACVVPHAGYIYSGPVAAHVYSKMEKSNFLIIGPNHQPSLNKYSLMSSGVWKTPLGSVKIDENFAKEILKCPLIKDDPISHKYEHSIEVQLPFLQYRFGDEFEFVPLIMVNDYLPEFLEECRVMGKHIAKVIKKIKERWIIIASSDFSHYVPYEYAYKVDNWVIESILKLDEEEFLDRIIKKRVGVCGFGGIIVTIVAAKELGAKKGELLKYGTSGDIEGKTSVVGYAGILIK